MTAQAHLSKVAAIAAAALLVWAPAPVLAALQAEAKAGPQTISSGTWGAVATLNTAAPYGTGPLNLSYTNTGTAATPTYAAKYFTVGNAGTLPITGASYTGTPTTPSGVSAQFVIESCSAAWNEATDSCSGTVATILTTPDGNTAATSSSPVSPAAAGSAIRLRARPIVTGVVMAGTPDLKLSVGVSVARSQVRAATTTSS